ncbi:MAG: amidohydrolase [Fidelibacterota bacterium]|nr:MAG: amidohydrolase [Candidatus Neomarinimicrobiota bacterium]
MSILIKDTLVNDERQDIYIEANRIHTIGKDLAFKADTTLDGTHKAALPSLLNSHTHAAMVLLRGYADDMPLSEWLNHKIWPFETRLTEEDVYWGTRLACLEMIKTGTTFFNDMYWYYHGVARAVEDAGIRAAVSAVFIDLFDETKAAEQIDLNQRLFQETERYSPRITFALGPHAIYTVSTRSLEWARDFADEHRVLIHTHLSETRQEVDDCLNRFGKRPVEYLHDIGLLGPNLVAAHVIWVDDHEIELLHEHQVKVVYNPTSNMKLSAGFFPYRKLIAAQVDVALGTDGGATNNNLDMLEEMKFAALLQKLHDGDPTALNAHEAFRLGTEHASSIFGLEAGTLQEGALADLILVDTRSVQMTPLHELISNLVYSAHGGCVDTTICDGRILMQDGNVEDEEEVLAGARKTVAGLFPR